MLRSLRTNPAAMRGVTLVELMVALVVGLIVVGAVLALVISIMKSNRESIQSTRLNQELRATMAVIVSDLRRARGVNDPLSTATAAGGNPYKSITTATAGCVVFGYDGAIGGAFHVIRRDAATNKVVLAAGAAPTCATAGIPLSSDQVDVTALTFTPTIPSSGATANNVRGIEVSITGHLHDDNAQLSAIPRTITQSVQIRSLGGN